MARDALSTVLVSWQLLSVFCRLVGGRRHRKDAEDSWKHCLIMDEVDGMAGNEDRGGIQVCNIFC